MNRFLKLLETQQTILADGAMGTMLFEAGLEQGMAPEIWNVEHPDRVRKIQRGYIDAGSQIILTNTFGGNRYRFGMHNIQSRVKELNRAGAQILRDEINAAGKDVIVAGDMGPTGEVLLPYGTLEFDDAVSAFAEQAEGLLEGGVDVIWIETMADLEELHAAIDGIRRVSKDIPIVATMTFDTHGRTMMGVTPEKAIQKISEWGVSALGGNCGNGPDELLVVIEKMRKVNPNIILVGKSNAGKPKWNNGKVIYQAGPEEMAEAAVQMKNAGARIIGGCCGSTPAHLQAMKQALS